MKQKTTKSDDDMSVLWNAAKCIVLGIVIWFIIPQSWAYEVRYLVHNAIPAALNVLSREGDKVTPGNGYVSDETRAIVEELARDSAGIDAGAH